MNWRWFLKGELHLLKAQPELWMDKLMLIRVISDLFELVHVELSDERRKPIRLKMLGQYFLREIVGSVHNEACPVRVPGNYLVKR